MKNSKRRLKAFLIASVMFVVSLLSLMMVACKTPEEQSYKITYQTENVLYGSVSGTCDSEQDVKKGTNVTLTATAEDEYSFTGWYVENDLKSTANPYTFSVSEEISLTAKFEYVGHVCAYNEHVSYSIDEDDVVYRTTKCSCGLTKTAQFTDYTSVGNVSQLSNALVSTGVKNRLVVLNSGWPYDRIELGLNHFDEGLTIIGKQGVIMKGLILNSKKGLYNANATTDVMASGVTIMGIEFTDDLQVYNCSMDKLTIYNCIFTDGAGINIRANSWTGIDEVDERESYQRNTISNTTIENCTFEGRTEAEINGVDMGARNGTKICLFDINGVTIKNNNISNCKYNAIQLNERSNDGVLGNVVIEGNTISNTDDRAIRINNIKGNITVKDNAFSNVNNGGEILKATSKVSTTVVVFSGNTLGGNAIEVNDAKAPRQ